MATGTLSVPQEHTENAVHDKKLQNGQQGPVPALTRPTLQRSRTSDLLRLHVQHEARSGGQNKRKSQEATQEGQRSNRMASSFAKLTEAIGVHMAEVEGLEEDEEDEEEDGEEEEEDGDDGRATADKSGYDSSDYYDTDLDCEGGGYI